MAELSQEKPPLPRRSIPRRRKFTFLPAWWPLVLFILIGVAGGASYSARVAPEYAATTYVVVVPAKGSDPATALGFAQAYGRLSTSTAILAYAQTADGVPDKLPARQVQAQTSPDSPVIEITGTSTSRDEAANIANAVADSLMHSGNAAAKDTGVRLVDFSAAIAPAKPVSPSLPVDIAVGGCAGGVIGALVLLVRPRREQWSVSTPVPAPARSGEPAAKAKEHI
ncbi:YveK family protein [Streptomyces himalayensis]|uniref:YveK family protein n=1 Tax=Streptomyces himalayensis TaxID=2820085 RepID=UPI001FE285E7|nr:lipopolysaccharide biosynthesis protein [Streptomyces himalayensis]